MTVKKWDGSSWVEVTQVGHWDGSSWIDSPVKYWDGTAWVTIYDPAPPNGLARYTFDGDVLDSWGSYDGTNSGGTFTTTRQEGTDALDFDGTSSYVELPNYTSGLFDGTNDWTISHWVYPRDLTSTQRLFHPRGQADCGTRITNSGEFDIYWWNPNGSNTVATTNITSGAWNHLVGVWDATNSEMRVYVDGNFEASGAIGDPYLTSSVNTFGCRPDNDSHYFDGIMDDPRLYDKAMTDTEVNDLYNRY